MYMFSLLDAILYNDNYTVRSGGNAGGIKMFQSSG